MSATVRPKDIPAVVVALCRELARHGYRAWVVGGCLRDLLRGQPASDWDLATTARPEDVRRVFPRVIPTGIQHGTVTVRLGGKSFEVTTLRGEGAYSDGRRPDSVEFVEDIRADLARRDFTVNAIAYDPLEDRVDDPFGGLVDLERRVIRAVGRAEERFAEDGLRVLRAARFVASLDFELDPETEAAIRPTLDTFRKVSAERVREEWLKALKARAPSRAFNVMARTGILEVTCPQLARTQPSLWQAALAALDAAPREMCVGMACLLSAWGGDPPEAIADWLTRYRFSNHERERIVRMLTHFRDPWAPVPSPPALRRFAQRMGRASLDEVLEVACRVADARFAEGAPEREHARAWAACLPELVRPDTPLSSKDLALTGRDLMTELGIKPGPALGVLIEGLLDHVLDDPSRNTRATLLDIARGLVSRAS